MKKLLACLLVLLMLLPCTASALVQLPGNPLVRDKALLKALKSTEYASWTLYQPNDRELEMDVTKDHAFKNYPYFPVLAVNGDETAVLLLRRTKKGWQLDGVNTKALTRPGFTLTQFTMDSYYLPEDQTMFIGFSFVTEDGANVELFLTPGEFGKRFSGISYIPRTRRLEHLFADSVSITFNSGLQFAYRNQETQNTWSFSMDSELPLAAYENFDAFDLSQAPLTLMDAMTPDIVAQETQLYQFPGEGAAMRTLSAGTEVLASWRHYGSDGAAWIPVYVDGLAGYVLRETLAGAQE